MLTKYMIIMKPVRRDLLKTLTEKERTLMLRHKAYFRGLQASGKANIQGSKKLSYVKKMYLHSSSKQDVEFLMLVDPAVQAGLLTPEIHDSGIVTSSASNELLSYSL